MVSEVVISNMKMRGFRFNDDGIPIECAPPLSGQALPEGNPFGTFGMVFDDYELAYRYDRTLYIRYPSSRLVGSTLQYTLTYVLDLQGFPVLRDDGRTTDEVINEHWMTATTWGSRLDNLRQVPDEHKQYPVQWWKDGVIVYARTIGEIIDMFLDPARLEAQKAYVKANMDAMREQAAPPLRPKEESDPPEVEDRPAAVVPEPKMVRAGRGVKLTEQSDGSILAEREDVLERVRWLPRKDNGFRHPNPVGTVYPSNIDRLALRHDKRGGAILRGWGSGLGDEIVNGVAVQFEYIESLERYEAELTPEQVEEIL